MIDLRLSRRSLLGWETGISKIFRKQLEIAQGQLVAEWIAELHRQWITGGDGDWLPLSPKYKKRKLNDLINQRNGVTQARPLARTGEMLAGYAAGIRTTVNKGKVGIEMPFPGDYLSTLNVRARSHQDNYNQPIGVPARKFDVSKFEDIAVDYFNGAMFSAARIASEK